MKIKRFLFQIQIHHEFYDEMDHCKDLSDLKKRKVEKKPVAKPPPKPIVNPVLRPPHVMAVSRPYVTPATNRFLTPYGAPVKAHSPFRPGVPSPMQTKRYKTLAEIYKTYDNRYPTTAVKLIGYDSDTDSDSSDYDSDSDSDSLYDRRVLRWVDYAKSLKDARPMMRSMYGLI